MTRRHTARHAARYLLLGAMSATLVGCGGGAGDSGTNDIDLGGGGLATPDDRDGDGIPNSEDPDFDASDLDGDMIQNNRDDDIDGDGVLNGEDDDIDGDGIPNASDPDEDGDGFDEATAENVCGDAAGTDAESVNNDWNDNCSVQRRNQFSDSLYSAGIQRVVYCSGQGNASSVDAYTDGEYGEGTEEAVTAFQTAYNAANPEFAIGIDGRVGPQTWAALQDALVVVQPAVLEGQGPFFDGYGVPGERCGPAEGDDAVVLFLNEITSGNAGISRLGWQLTKGATDATPVPFSTGSPFGQID